MRTLFHQNGHSLAKLIKFIDKIVQETGLSDSAPLVCLVDLDGHAQSVGFKCSFHDLHDEHHLLVGDDLLLLTVNCLDEVTVEVVHVSRRLGNRLLGNRLFISGSHGLGQTRSGLNGLCILD